MSIYGNEDSVSYKNIGLFLLEYQAAQNAIYGESSTLNIVSGGTTTSVALTNDTATPRTIDNLEMAEIGGVYLAYTTVEKSDTSYTADDGTVKPDILYTRRLFLRTVTVDGSGWLPSATRISCAPWSTTIRPTIRTAYTPAAL